jgi:hypothetical protein
MSSKKSVKLKSTMRVSECGIVEYVLDDGYTLHRNDDRPAKIDPIGVFSYWVNGRLHRRRGPAVVGPDGSKSFYHNGEWLMTVRADGETYVNDRNGNMVCLGNT